jgi:hypothetical protein
LETGSLAAELTPLFQQVSRSASAFALQQVSRQSCIPLTRYLADALSSYLVSLWSVCLRQRLQNFENSRRPVVVFLFFVVE